MIRNLCSAIFITTLLVMSSCNRDKKQEAIDGNFADLNMTDSRSTVDFSDKNIQEIYTVYLDIKAGLVNSDNEAVRTASKKMEEVLETSNENKQLKATSKLISLTKDIKKQRDFFVTITDEVQNRISDAQITSGEVYKQYCPMAFEGSGGYWLSDSEEIRNPYFGKKMLKCGSVEEVFK